MRKHFCKHLHSSLIHRYRKSQNRLLNVCYVPATSASLPRVNFFFSFLFLLQWTFTVLIKQTRQTVCVPLSSLYIIRCLCSYLYAFNRYPLVWPLMKELISLKMFTNEHEDLSGRNNKVNEKRERGKGGGRELRPLCKTF
jgi:hypothetical protein